MAKVHLDRLSKRGYAPGTVKNKKYRALVQHILFNTNRAVHNRIGEITSKEWNSVNRKMPKTQRQLILPDLDEVLPGRSIQALKSAQQGNLITDTLRDALTKKIKEKVLEFTEKPTAKVSRNLVKEFEKDIREVYDGYTKKDPRFGMPTNVHTIAVTEIRVPIAQIKAEYVRKMEQKNPDVEVLKKWVHNKSLSKDPRPGHMRLNGTTIPLKEMFHVKQFKKVKGKWRASGVELQMRHPHDPSAPEGEVIGCSCDCVYITRRRKK